MKNDNNFKQKENTSNYPNVVTNEYIMKPAHIFSIQRPPSRHKTPPKGDF